MKPIFSFRIRERWLSVRRLTSWPSNVYRPPSNSSSRPATFRNVVFPEPECPVIATNSPGSTFRARSRSAWVSTTSVRNTLLTFCIWIMTVLLPFTHELVGQAHLRRVRKLTDARNNDLVARVEPGENLHFPNTHRAKCHGLACSHVTLHAISEGATVNKGTALDLQRVVTPVQNDAHVDALVLPHSRRHPIRKAHAAL